MELWDLVMPLGIISYLGLIIMMLTGMRIIKSKMKIHKTVGFITFIIASFHVFIVIYTSYM